MQTSCPFQYNRSVKQTHIQTHNRIAFANCVYVFAQCAQTKTKCNAVNSRVKASYIGYRPNDHTQNADTTVHSSSPAFYIIILNSHPSQTSGDCRSLDLCWHCDVSDDQRTPAFEIVTHQNEIAKRFALPRTLAADGVGGGHII